MKTCFQLLPFSVTSVVVVAITATLVGCDTRDPANSGSPQVGDATIVITDEPYVPPAKRDQVKVSGQIAKIDGQMVTINTSVATGRTVEVADSATVWSDGDKVGMKSLRVGDVIDLFCESKQDAIKVDEASDDQL